MEYSTRTYATGLYPLESGKHNEESLCLPTEPRHDNKALYGATESSIDDPPISTVPETESSIERPIVGHHHHRHETNRIRPSNHNEHHLSRIALFLNCLFALHYLLRDFLVILGSIPHDDDHDDDHDHDHDEPHEGMSSLDEGESSHGRMTTTTASLSAARHNTSRSSETMRYTVASSQGTSHARMTQDRLGNFHDEDRSGLGRRFHSTISSTRFMRKHVLIKNKQGRRILGRIIWLLILAGAYSTERCTFKILLDRMGPFRLVVGTIASLAIYIVILLLWILFTILSMGGKNLFLQIVGKKRVNSTSVMEYLGGRFGVGQTNKIFLLPLADIGMIAVFDSLSLLLAAISSSHVTPILIIILVQLNIPLSLVSRYFCGERSSDRTLSPTHDENTFLASMDGYNKQLIRRNTGAFIIVLSIFISLLPVYLPRIDPTRFIFKTTSIPWTDSTMLWNTAFFALSCVPAAASQAYKHHSLTETAQPVDATLMNFILSVISLILIFVLSPLLYSLQGLAAPITEDMNITQWIELYPSYEYSINFHHGLECILGTISDEVQRSGYPEVAQCEYAWALLLVHVLSILTMQFALDKMCAAAAPKLISHSMSWGLLIGSSTLFLYGGYDYSSLLFWALCIGILILGSEMYQQSSIEMDSFETVYEKPCGEDATSET